MTNNNITAQKTFPAPVNELYKAWTDESALKQWWQPSGRKLQLVEAALENGGALKYTFEPDKLNNSKLVIEGKYETVIPNERLVYSWNWKLDDTPVKDGMYKLSVDFKSDGEGSEIMISQETEAQEEGIHPNEEGWDISLGELKKYLLGNGTTK